MRLRLFNKNYIVFLLFISDGASISACNGSSAATSAGALGLSADSAITAPVQSTSDAPAAAHSDVAVDESVRAEPVTATNIGQQIDVAHAEQRPTDRERTSPSESITGKS